jgi:hypothetical protein
MQLTRVQSRMHEVEATRSAIENETLADTETILHRLRSTEGSKLASLQADYDTLATDIAAIDGFYQALQAYQPGPLGLNASASNAASLLTATSSSSTERLQLSDPYDTSVALEFMRAYPQICAEADRLTTKPVKVEVNIHIMCMSRTPRA